MNSTRSADESRSPTGYPASSTLRVATWNVHEGVPVEDGTSPGTAVDNIVGLISDLKVDVIGLQEVDFDQESHSSILKAIHEYTSLSHSVYHVLSESSFHVNKNVGVAIASRYALINVRRECFSNPRLGTRIGADPMQMHDKGFVSATAISGGRRVTVASLHAFPFHVFDRKAEDPDFGPLWSEMSHRIATVASASLIVCGDFNTSRRDLILCPARLALQRAVVKQGTYSGQAFDDILFGHDFEPAMARVVENFSDHHLCITELAWKS